MVKFESKKTSDGLFLTVKDDNDGEKTLIIAVFTPAIGPFGGAWQVEHNPPNLDCWSSGKPSQAILSSSHHHDDVTSKPLSTLYHRILQKEVAWPSRIHYRVEFSHIPLYWEWAEDNIRRCKLTLSNLDLLDAVGLLITGMLYDEVVPVADELEDSKDGRHFLPFNCKYMFAALQRIRSQSGKSYATFEECPILLWPSYDHPQLCWRGDDCFHGPNAIRTLTGADAKASIRSGKELNWVSNLMNGTTDMKAVDKGLTKKETDFFLSIRSCYLTLRHDNRYVVELYSPHLFIRQFGFCQDVPVGTKSSFLIPSCGMNIHSRVTPAFASWWKSTYALFTKSPSPPASLGTGPSCKRKADNTTREAASKAPATSSDKVKNKAKPSRQSTSRSPRASSHGSSEDKSANVFQDIFSDTAGDDEIRVALHDDSPIPTMAPSFKAQDMIFEADRYVVGFLVKQIKTKLLHTPLSNIPALDPELKELFSYITTKNIDVTSLHEHVEAYVSHVHSFHALESSENVQPSLSRLEERLTDVELHLSDVVNLKRKEEEQIKSQQVEILKIEQRCDELQKKLKLLEQKKSKLSFALATFEDSLDKHDAAIKELTVSHSSIKKEIAATREATTKRKKAEENFQSARTALESAMNCSASPLVSFSFITFANAAENRLFSSLAVRG
ncbi:Myosin-9, partial [Bienertia sinuspersici]